MVGSSLSHYRILDELGRGGMGIVYKAEDTKLDRTVAIKVLPAAALVSEDDRARFYREAKAAAALTHPNLAVVYEVGEAADGDGGDAHPFIAMEYIAGESLDDVIRKGPLPLDRILEIASEVADGLKAAHSRSIVHRDIKAANVMLDEQGRAKVLDFGLAMTAASTKLTRLGSTMGTVAYMSPEQARGEEVDHRTDIWALGVLIYEMTAGTNPFGGDYEQAIVYHVLNEDPPPLTSLRTGVPIGLEWIVNKCLSKDRNARYASMADLLVDLESVEGISRRLSTLATGERPVVATSATTRPKAIWPLTAAAALVLGALLGSLLFGSDRDVEERVRTFPLDFREFSLVNGVSTSPDGRYAALGIGPTSNLANDAFLWDMETGELTLLGTGGFYSMPQFTPSGEEVLYSSYTGGTFSVRVADAFSSMVDPEKYYPAMDEEKNLYYVDRFNTAFANSGVNMTRSDGAEAGLVVARDEQLSHRGLFPWKMLDPAKSGLGIASRGIPGTTAFDIVWLDLEEGSYTVLVASALPVGLDQDGVLFYQIQGSDEEWRMEARKLDTGAGRFTGEARGIRMDIGQTDMFTLGSDGSLFAFYRQSDPRRVFWHDADGQEISEFEIDPDVNYQPRVSHDGTRVVAHSINRYDGDIYVNVYGIEDGSNLRIAEGHAGADPAWSHDDEWVYVTGMRDSPTPIVRIRSDGSGITDTLSLSHPWAREVHVTRDGRKIAFMAPGPTGAWNLYGYDLESGEEFTIREDDAYLHDPFWSPDGRYIAYEYTFGEGDYADGQSVRVRDTESDGDWLISENVSQPRFWDPEFSPDGRYLYFRDPNNLYRRPVQFESGFLPQGRVEHIAEIRNDFTFSFAPDGRMLIQKAVVTSDVELPDVYVVENWLQDWKRTADLD